ncbi:MAG: DUF1292 domain-containing protein [Selenomonadaceae bacterium]|nr:DUF1292 domain-containing protein [Selenomonadaceae bacterium]MBR4696289.1 DUF1292 domain-containing protein [Selenomonadaceae bacterium]
MAEQEAKALAEEEDAVVVEFKDEDGNSLLYEQEMIIPVNGENFALLFGIQQEDQEHEHGCGCGCEDDDGDVIIAKVIVNEDGEEEYVEPSDEEFEAVQKAYDELLKDLDVEEEEKEKAES